MKTSKYERTMDNMKNIKLYFTVADSKTFILHLTKGASSGLPHTVFHFKMSSHFIHV